MYKFNFQAFSFTEGEAEAKKIPFFVKTRVLIKIGADNTPNFRGFRELIKPDIKQ